MAHRSSLSLAPLRACLPAALLVLMACNRVQPLPGAAPAAAAVPADLANRGADEALALLEPRGDGQVEKDLRTAQARVRRDPSRADAWVALGQLWVRKARGSTEPNRYLSANAAATLALRAEPQHRGALGLRSLVLMNDHKFEAARALAQASVARDATDSLAWGTLSDALLELGRFDEAARAAQAMMDLKPTLPAYSRASYLLWLQGDAGKAKEAARLAIDAGQDTRDPEPLAWMLVQAAHLFWFEGDLAGAEAGYQRSLSLSAHYPPALTGLGRVQLARGEANAAAASLTESLARYPLPETAWLLADARAAAGDAAGAAEAEAWIRKVGRLVDPRTTAAFLAARGLAADEAVSLAEEELKTRGDLYTHDAAAWALYRKGRFDEARRHSDLATALGTRDPRLWFHAGAIRLAQGDAEGRALIAQALAQNGAFEPEGAAEARKLLQPPARASR